MAFNEPWFQFAVECSFLYGTGFHVTFYQMVVLRSLPEILPRDFRSTLEENWNESTFDISFPSLSLPPY